MNVFADLHHGDLYYSLQLLFEKRFGWKLYRPIGRDWYDRGYWYYASNNDPLVIEQYLGNPAESKLYTGIIDGKDEGDHYRYYDMRHSCDHRALTLDQFKKMPIDIIIATVPWNEEKFARLAKDFKPDAKLIRQEGNSGSDLNGIFKNVMASFVPDSVPPEINFQFYHQEFDLDIFDYRQPARHNRVINLMNCLPSWLDYPVWQEYKALMPDFEWRMHGIQGEEGNLDGIRRVADALHETTFVFHLKYMACAGGHVMMNALATGKPMIVKGSYLGGDMKELVDGYNCIDLEKRSPEDNVKFIKECSQPENYARMSQNTYNTFKKICDFDREFEQVKEFIGRLK